MKKLRQQIKESFFNPILYLLPLLLFLVTNEFWGRNLALAIAGPTALLMLIYVYYLFNQIIVWHLIFTFVFMGIGIIANLTSHILNSVIPQHLEDKSIVIAFLVGLLIFRKRIQKIISNTMPKLVPMTNNFNELYRVVWTLLAVMIFYISSYLFIQTNKTNEAALYIQLLQMLYAGIIAFLSCYEIVRVRVLRTKLLREEWWPIVSDQGKVIGSIEHFTSLNDEKKYLHPVVRVAIIDKGMILLQKRSENNSFYSGLWDTAISNHVGLGDNIEQSIDRTATERYGVKNLKYIHLSNYRHESSNEIHYAFLFASCQLPVVQINTTMVEQIKWWTQDQIEENIELNIFSENFILEFEILKRSGLLETEKCECECKLKETIYQQPCLLR